MVYVLPPYTKVDKSLLFVVVTACGAGRGIGTRRQQQHRKYELEAWPLGE